MNENKFESIHQTIQKYKLKCMVSHLYELMGVSRSGYYHYFNEQSTQNRARQDEADEVSFPLPSNLVSILSFQHQPLSPRGNNISNKKLSWK